MIMSSMVRRMPGYRIHCGVALKGPNRQYRLLASDRWKKRLKAQGSG